MVADGVNKTNARLPMINVAHRKVARLIKMSKDDTTSITLVHATILYNLPADYREVYKVQLNGVKLEPIEEDKLDHDESSWRTNEGTPTKYFVRKGQRKIGFYPVSDGVITPAVITLTYGYVPATVVESGVNSSLVTPEECDQAVIDYVIWKIAESVYDHTTASRHSQMFGAFEQEFAEDIANSQEDGYPETVNEMPKRSCRNRIWGCSSNGST